MGVSVRVCEGRVKNGGLLVNKQGQRRDVRPQRCDVPEGGGANVATLRSNVTKFQRGYKSNVATSPMSRRSREW